MTEQKVKEAMQYRRTMHNFLESGAVMDGADDWIRMELHNQEREMRGEVAASLRNERNVQEMKRPAGQGESSLRSRLKNLVSSILAHRGVERNG